MCTVCDAYADCLPVQTPGELTAVVSMVAGAVSFGDLEWLDGDAVVRSLDAPQLTRAAARRPVQALGGRWLCSACSRLFLLEMNSSAVTGDVWRPLYGN